MNSVLKIALATTVLVLALPCASHAQKVTPERLQQRIDSLERRISELERRLAAVEGAPTRAAERPRPLAGNSKELTNWRRLREDMTYEDVRALLGEPTKIDGGGVAFWHYPDFGAVTFISGRVSSWSEPTRPDRS